MLCGVIAFGQQADGRNPLFPGGDDPDRPKGIKESLEKMRIAKEKKEYDEMLARGEEAVKVSTEVKNSYTQTGSLSDNDIQKVAKIEKLVKKIRDELGGDDDDNATNDPTAEASEPSPTNTSGAIDALKARADALYEQLKKTTRFTISTAAIVSSNALLKVAKFLKLRH